MPTYLSTMRVKHRFGRNKKSLCALSIIGSLSVIRQKLRSDGGISFLQSCSHSTNMYSSLCARLSAALIPNFDMSSWVCFIGSWQSNLHLNMPRQSHLTSTVMACISSTVSHTDAHSQLFTVCRVSLCSPGQPWSFKSSVSVPQSATIIGWHSWLSS